MNVAASPRPGSVTRRYSNSQTPRIPPSPRVGSKPPTSPLPPYQTPAGATSRRLLNGRVRYHHFLLLLVIYGAYRFIASRPEIPIPSSMSFCPSSTSHRHVPTVILQAEPSSTKDSNRTYWVGGNKPAKFLPLAYPPRDLRLAQSIVGDGAKVVHRKGKGNLHSHEPEEGKQVCEIHRVPASAPPALPKKWSHNKVMFGMSTTADRVLYNLPVWSHWLPSHDHPLDPTTPITKDLPLVLILTPPPNPTEKARRMEALDEAQVLGMFVEMRDLESDRFETRYFALAQEMWAEAEIREREQGVRTEWFIFSDDDTFFPDFNSLVRMLSQYDPDKPHIIGALSESTHQVEQWGHLAYGGAGIYVSRAMLEKMNAPGMWETCLTNFGSSFGGDAMVTNCAALATDKTVQEVLTLDETLHQLDIRGDGTGWFQSGFLITSLHHWGSWFTLFPPWHESGSGDLRTGVTLVGKAAKAIGGDNWGRRYIFEDGKVTVNIGYSVTVELKALTEAELEKSEHTWWEFETFHPIREGLLESVDKRTYYITGVRVLGDGVVRLEHKNREGERVDIVWDGRGEKKGGWGRKPKESPKVVKREDKALEGK